MSGDSRGIREGKAGNWGQFPPIPNFPCGVLFPLIPNFPCGLLFPLSLLFSSPIPNFPCGILFLPIPDFPCGLFPPIPSFPCGDLLPLFPLFPFPLPNFPGGTFPSHPQFPSFLSPSPPRLRARLPSLTFPNPGKFPVPGWRCSGSSALALALGAFLAHAGIRSREPRPPGAPEKLPDKDKWLPFFPKAKKVGIARNSWEWRRNGAGTVRERGLPRILGVLPQIPGVLPQILGVLPQILGVLPQILGVLPQIPGVLPQIPGFSP